MVTELIARQIHTLAALAGPDARPEAAITSVCVLAVVAIAGWVGLGLVLAALAALPGATGRCADRAALALTPALARRLLAAALGSASVASPVAAWAAAPGLTLPAPGQPAGPVDRSPTAAARAPVLAPARTVAQLDPPGQPGSSGAAARPAAPSPGTVTVRPGDTLWGLARSALGRAHPDSEVAALWPRWWEANRTVIGTDPSLLQPGQVLHVPSPSRSAP